MAEKGITLYCAGCEPALLQYRQFFIALSLITGGKYVALDNADHLTNVIVGGTREEISMEKMMAQVHNEVMKEAAEKGTRVDEDALTRRIHKLLNSKSKIQNLINFIFKYINIEFIIADGTNKINKVENSIEINDGTKELSKTKTLKELVQKANETKVNLVSNSFSYTPAALFTSSFKKLAKTCVKRVAKTKPKTKRM